MIRHQAPSTPIDRSASRSRRRGLLALGVMATIATIATGAVGGGVARALTVPDFPTSPTRVELPTGGSGSAFVPMPGLCGDGGVLHGSIGAPVFAGTIHAVSHMGFANLCTPQAGLQVEFKMEAPFTFTGLVTVTIITIDGLSTDKTEHPKVGPYTVEFYMGVPIPEPTTDSVAGPLPVSGGGAGGVAWAGLVTLVAGAALVVGSRRRRSA